MFHPFAAHPDCCRPSSRVVGLLAVCLAVLGVLGCQTDARDVNVRPVFNTYDKVAIWPPEMSRVTGQGEGGLVRLHEELFLPRWMSAFPSQSVVERRDLGVAIGEQELLPERMKAETRAKLREIYGVKAIVFPNYSVMEWCQLHIKVIDTETGEDVAAITRKLDLGKKQSVNRAADALIERAIHDLRAEAARAGTEPGGKR
jgi:hypothetical protein